MQCQLKVENECQNGLMSQESKQ